MGRTALVDLHEKYIKETPAKSIVAEQEILLCPITMVCAKQIFEQCKRPTRVYMTSKALKHLYDAKPAEEFDFIMKNIVSIIRYPKHIYKNQDPKRGHVCFVKSILNQQYFCSLEKDGDKLYIVTCFRLRDEKYLKSYDLLWSWRSDEPSS